MLIPGRSTTRPHFAFLKERFAALTFEKKTILNFVIFNNRSFDRRRLSSVCET